MNQQENQPYQIFVTFQNIWGWLWDYSTHFMYLSVIYLLIVSGVIDFDEPVKMQKNDDKFKNGKDVKLTQEDQDNFDPLCLICMANTKTVAFQCGHICCCFVCNNKLIEQKGECPMCKVKIVGVMKVFI